MDNGLSSQAMTEETTEKLISDKSFSAGSLSKHWGEDERDILWVLFRCQYTRTLNETAFTPCCKLIIKGTVHYADNADWCTPAD